MSFGTFSTSIFKRTLVSHHMGEVQVCSWLVTCLQEQDELVVWLDFDMDSDKRVDRTSSLYLLVCTEPLVFEVTMIDST